MLSKIGSSSPIKVTMPPALVNIVSRSLDLKEAAKVIRDQSNNPGDVFSVLLILGGDVVARALAQLVGSRVVPVAFSFGTHTPCLFTFNNFSYIF